MSTGDGDGWVALPDGSHRWGRYGASGLLLHATDAAGTGHVLLQHRAAWSHYGDTWGMPGGARDSDESAVQAALREFGEEVSGDLGEIVLTGVHRQDHSVWRYDTVLAGTPGGLRPFTPGNRESTAINWVALPDVERMPLLPAFARIWPDVRAALTQRLVLVVDGPAVLRERPAAGGGPRPATGEGNGDGGGHGSASVTALARLRDALAGLAASGVSGAALPAGLPLAALHRWFPRVVLVAGPEAGPVVAHAPKRKRSALGDVEVVTGGPDNAATMSEHVRRQTGAPAVLAVTGEAGAVPDRPDVVTVSPRWLLDLLDPTRAATGSP